MDNKIIKVGLLEVQLVKDNTPDIDGCIACIFYRSKKCPCNCSGDHHYKLTEEFINIQTKNLK